MSIRLLTTAKAIVSASLLLASATSLAAPSFQLPAYEKLQLDNGLTVYLLPQHEVPLLTVQVTVKAGAVLDTKPGLADLTSQSLMLGADTLTKAQVAETVDFLGASLNTSSDQEYSRVTASFMAKDSDKMLDLVKATLLTPKFANDEFDKLKQRQLAAMDNAKQSPREMIDAYFMKQLYGKHPYGHQAVLDSDAMKKIKLTDVRNFYQQYYQPDNSAIAVVGDFEPAVMKTKLSQLFSNWRGKTSGKMPDLTKELPTLSQTNVLVVDKPDAIETTFMIGGMGVPQSNPDYVGISVINTILGGRFTSWLNDELRVNSGLTYGARSSFNRFGVSGTFAISTFTKKSSTEQAIDLALKTYQKLFEQGLDQATLDSAKAYVKGQFPPRYETNGALASLLSGMFVYGYDERYINDFQQKVDSLTLEESKRLITQYFPKQHLQFVLVGNASEIAPIAAKYGTVRIADIKAGKFATTAPK